MEGKWEYTPAPIPSVIYSICHCFRMSLEGVCTLGWHSHDSAASGSVMRVNEEKREMVRRERLMKRECGGGGTANCRSGEQGTGERKTDRD